MIATAPAPNAEKVRQRHDWISGGRMGHAPGCQSHRPLVFISAKELKDRFRGQRYNFWKVGSGDSVLVCLVCQGVIEAVTKNKSLY